MRVLEDDVAYTDQEFFGRETIPGLAEIFEQIYIPPGPEGEKLYESVAVEGGSPPSRDLSHFIGSEKDSSVFMDTPAGKVRVVTLAERADFVTMLQTLGEKCAAVPVPQTQGAVILDGLINHKKINAFREKFYADHPEADDQQWLSAFEQFRKDRENYREAFILLSVGPYSAVPACALGLSRDRWLALSLIIRKYHECTHFLCRRLFPGRASAVWDELVADTVGVFAAFGKFEIYVAETGLGIQDGVYRGGRLENYVGDLSPERMNALAGAIHDLFLEFERMAERFSAGEIFQLAVALENRQQELGGAIAAPACTDLNVPVTLK